MVFDVFTSVYHKPDQRHSKTFFRFAIWLVDFLKFFKFQFGFPNSWSSSTSYVAFQFPAHLSVWCSSICWGSSQHGAQGHFPGEGRYTLIARSMGPTWGPSGANRTQVGPMLAPWTLLSGYVSGRHHQDMDIDSRYAYNSLEMLLWHIPEID